MYRLGLTIIIFLSGCSVDPPKPPLPDGMFKPVNVVQEPVVQQQEPVVVKKKAKKRKHRKVRRHGS